MDPTALSPRAAEGIGETITGLPLAVIVFLLGMCGWLFRKAFRLPRQAPIVENGQRISRQEYITILEGEINRLVHLGKDIGPRVEGLEADLQRYIGMLTTQKPQIEAHKDQLETLEDQISVCANDLRSVRQLAFRIEQAQKQQRADVTAQLEEILRKLPA